MGKFFEDESCAIGSVLIWGFTAWVGVTTCCPNPDQSISGNRFVLESGEWTLKLNEWVKSTLFKHLFSYYTLSVYTVEMVLGLTSGGKPCCAGTLRCWNKVHAMTKEYPRWKTTQNCDSMGHGWSLPSVMWAGCQLQWAPQSSMLWTVSRVIRASSVPSLSPVLKSTFKVCFLFSTR